MIYPFRMTMRKTANRSAGELRGQIRYGSESSWHTDDHRIAWDVANVDSTLMLGVSPEDDLIVGLDPHLYDPLPMGISFYAQAPVLGEVDRSGWHVWERENHAGTRRTAPRTQDGLETLAAFRPNRLMAWADFSRQSENLGLDQSLRFGLAERLLAGVDASGTQRVDTQHALERQFDLSAAEILQMITERFRLQVAVRGGVAEHHLERLLEQNPLVQSVTRLDQDGEPDFEVALPDALQLRIECKNSSPMTYSDGTPKVEVQKTRASAKDPSSRFYDVDHFDVVAACMYPVTGEWNFRFAQARLLDVHKNHPRKLAPLQRIDDRWWDTFEGALSVEPVPVGAERIEA